MEELNTEQKLKMEKLLKSLVKNGTSSLIINILAANIIEFQASLGKIRDNMEKVRDDLEDKIDDDIKSGLDDSEQYVRSFMDHMNETIESINSQIIELQNKEIESNQITSEEISKIYEDLTTKIAQTKSLIPTLPEPIDLGGFKSEVINEFNERLRKLHSEIENKVSSSILTIENQLSDKAKENEIKEEIETLKKLIKDLEEKNKNSGGKVGWGAHPLVIQEDGTTISKVTRIINFSTGVTATANSQGIITVTASGGSTTAVETPSGSINGSNILFTVTYVPLWIVLNGVSYFANNGYTFSGDIITLDSSIVPATGSVLRSIHNSVAVTPNYLTDSSGTILTDSLGNPLTI